MALSVGLYLSLLLLLLLLLLKRMECNTGCYLNLEDFARRFHHNRWMNVQDMVVMFLGNWWNTINCDGLVHPRNWVVVDRDMKDDDTFNISFTIMMNRSDGLPLWLGLFNKTQRYMPWDSFCLRQISKLDFVTLFLSVSSMCAGLVSFQYFIIRKYREKHVLNLFFYSVVWTLLHMIEWIWKWKSTLLAWGGSCIPITIQQFRRISIKRVKWFPSSSK